MLNKKSKIKEFTEQPQQKWINSNSTITEASLWNKEQGNISLVNIDLNNSFQGSGKTHNIKWGLRKGHIDALVTSQHDHIEDDFADLEEATHRYGLTSWMEENSIDTETIEKAKDLQEKGLKPSYIAEMLLGKENGYKKQFDTNPPYLDPVEFLNIPSYKGFNTIAIDEGLEDKRKRHNFNAEKGKIQSSIKALIEYDEENKELYEDAEHLLFKLIEQWRSKTHFSSYDEPEEVVNNENTYLKIEEKETETNCLTEYRFRHPCYLFDLEDEQELDFAAQLQDLKEKIIPQLRSVLKKAANESEDVMNAAGVVLRLTKVASESVFHPVMVSETWVEEDGSFTLEVGQVLGKNLKTMFYFYVPTVFQVFKLAIEDHVDVKWGWAGFNEQWFQRMEAQFYNYRLRKDKVLYERRPEKFHNSTTPEGYHDIYKLDKFPDTNVFDIDSELEDKDGWSKPAASVTQVTRKTGTWSRSSLREGEGKWKSKFKARMGAVVHSFDDGSTGFIGYKDFLTGEYNEASTQQPTIFGEIPFLYWDGGGIQGTNKFADFDRIFLIGVPNKGEADIINRYFELYGDFPELDNSDVYNGKRSASSLQTERKTNRNGMLIGYQEEKVDLVHRLSVRSKVTDAALRLRSLRWKSKEVFAAGLTPQKLMKLDDDVSKKSLNRLVVEALDKQGRYKELCNKAPLHISEAADKWCVKVLEVEKLVKQKREEGGSLIIAKEGMVRHSKQMSDYNIEQKIIELLQKEPRATTEIADNIDASYTRISDKLEDLREQGAIVKEKVSDFPQEYQWTIQ